MCHVALGIVEAYWEYRLKPWDMAAGALVKVVFLQMLLLHMQLDSISLFEIVVLINGVKYDLLVYWHLLYPTCQSK
jgi:hypothetical protein